MKIFLILSLSIIGLAALVFVAGLSLPPTREGRADMEVAAPPERVAAVITDVARQPEWRDGITTVEVEGDGWVETTTRGEVIRFAWTRREALTLALTFRSDAGYHGTWQADLQPQATGTRVTVVERATIDNPLGRIIARLMFDPQAFAARYLQALKIEAER
ncbi:SRPBCC family protein [Rhizobium sp. AQ_MP]|uniref:SRPBCC family protein n=1 Tax=Rhizobium sp. AQ_MP TaxID=2761536 RepID=UPI001639DE11|nr:SRPBCC family protein [Rhizobium sp. AQ_MP]